MKKILTVFLAFLLILTMLPAGGAVYAEDSGGGSGGGGVDVSNVTNIEIINPPKLTYIAGEQLVLGPFDNDDGLFVKLEFNEGNTYQYVGYDSFEEWGITTDPANGTELTAAHNGQQIKLTCNGIEVLTDPLVVTSAEAEGANLLPATADFDKKSANQADVRIEVQWWNSVQTISGVKSGDSYLVSGEDYNFSGDSTNGYFLTIKKEYLAKQPEGSQVLTVEFSLGSSALLTVNIVDTGDVNPPAWPEGSTLTESNVTSDSARLSWTAATDDLAVTSYRIYQNDTLIQTVAGNVTTCEITGLSSDTDYTFRIEAGNGKGKWTTDGPSVKIKTEAGAAVTGLSLKAPRYTLEGHLFMGDTVSIEMVSNQSGLSPEVTVSYKEWNVDSTATEDKTSTLTLTETSSGSKTYAANFILSAGICEVTTLAGKLKPDSFPYEVVVNYRVAGRIKLTVQAPAGLDSEQVGIYNDFLKDTFAVAYKTNSWVSFTSETKDPEKPNEFTIEGVSGNDHFQAASYELKHYKEVLIYENDGTVPVIDGQESVCQYSIDSFSHLKVRVVDDETGDPIENALVRSPQLIYVNGKRDYNLSALTGNDGYAVTSGAYFAQNLMRGQELELSAYSALYESKKEVVAAGSLAVGENSIEIRLKKVPIVTLQGTVKGSTNKPLEQVLVRVPLMALDGTDISVTALTDENGRYSLQVPKTAKTVFFSKFSTNIDKPLALVDGKNTLDVQMPPITARVKVFVETKDIYGNITQLDLNWRVNAHLHISAKNLTNNNTGLISNGNCTIEGEPGDEIEVNVDGYEGGFGQASGKVFLNEYNYAEVRVVLTPSAQQPKIHVSVTDQNSNPRLGETRYMFLFNEDGRLVSRIDSTAPEISYSVLPGVYRAAFSWQGTISSDYLADWENRSNCLITETFFEVLQSQDTYLGTIPLSYSEADPYFRQNTAAGVTCSQRAAIPGSVVSLRVGYDYDNLKAIDGGELDLVAQIPADAELVEGSVLHRSTRGNAGSAEPEISGNKVILDLKDHIQGAAGVLTYQVRLKSPAVFDSISAGAELKFTAGGNPVSENIGFVEIPCRFITINAPLEIRETAKSDPVTLSGLAPANQTVELYDGDVKIGETQAAPSGVWAMNVILPDRGTPIYHRLTASIVVDDLPYTAEAAVLVGSKGTEIANFVMMQGDTSVNIKPQHNFIEFPLVITPSAGDSVVRISFEDNDKVSNVKMAGEDAIFQNNVYQAFVPYTTPLITVEYDEEAAQPEEILRHDFGIAPEYLRKAEVEFTDSNHTAADTRVGYGADGYLSEFLLPEVQISVRDGDKEGYGTVSMEVETAPFDPANAQNRTYLRNGMYGYDFSAELVNGKYVITGYLDRGLLPKQAFEVAGKQSNMRIMAASGITAGLEFVKSTIEVAGNVEELTGAFGDLSKSARMAHLLYEYESIRPNIEPHLQDYYDRRISMMGEDIIMGKSLGFVQDGVAEAANLVPLAGQVVCGIAKYISGKLLGDMFDKEFESDYNILRSEFSNLPGSQNWYDRMAQSRWPTYNPETGLYSIPHRLEIRPHYIMDPSGYVYEAVEENRLSNVTATALFLPKEKAATAALAKASTEWQVWNAKWYLQENPVLTSPDGRYAWDVPEGWWMVQFMKDGYQTTYSDALSVPPPQVDINIPMVKLAKPAVDEVIWGSGGRYVDVYFTKYMDTRTLEAASAFRLTDAGGNPVAGAVSYPEGVKPGVNGSGASGLTLTKTVRFTPSVPLTTDAQYTLTVNRAVADYAGFSMTADYTVTETVSAAEALIASISGSDINVEPGQDITQNLKNALKFTPVNPGDENLLDTRAVFVSSNSDVVSIAADGKTRSLVEGTAQITATSVDDPTKNAVFTVTVAYPPSPVRVSKMVILGSNGRALTELNLSQGSTYDLNPIISPADAANQAMSYFSDNPAVASVDASGKIRAIAKGIAIITAKTEDKNIRQMIHVKVTEATPTSGGGGGFAPPSASTLITGKQISDCLSSNQSFNLQLEGLQIAIDPQDLPVLPAGGDSIKIQTSVITNPNTLNSFFTLYPGRQGIMKAFNITMTRQRSGGSPETVTRLNGEITLTFQLTPEELEGIDPASLVVYKRAEDGGITEYTPEFDWENYALSITTDHLCEFYIMGEKGIPTQRLAGVDCYATAAAISAWGFKTSDHVVLASGENFPDALAGTALAAMKDAPILLTARDILSSETLAEIKRLKAKTIYLLGGTAVISTKVEEALAKEYTVIRIAGWDKYETAVRIGELVGSADTAVISAGFDYPDALSIAPFAGQYGLPILFTEQDELNALTVQALNQWGVKNIILTGGSSVISARVENILRNEMKLNVTRLYGLDRYLTGLEIAKHFAAYSTDGVSNADSIGSTNIIGSDDSASRQTTYPYAALATGINFPDALAGAALAAKLKMPVLLTGKEKISPDVRDYLKELNLKKLYVFGGWAVIADKLVEEISRID